MTGWRESREERETHGQLHEQESWRERERERANSLPGRDMACIFHI